jgi:hypothetical protein
MRVLFATMFALAAVVAGCGGDDVSREEYQTEVVEQRQRLEESLQAIVQAQTYEDVVDRLEIAGRTAQQSAEDLRETGAPSALDDEAKQLVFALEAFSVEVNNTADSLRRDIGANLGQKLEGLHFETWDDVDEALQDLRADGIAVEPLRPLGPEAQR